MRGVLAALLAAVAAPLATGLEEQLEVATSFCQNTRLGRLYLADSTGHVCPRASFLSSTGCCDTSDAASKKMSAIRASLSWTAAVLPTSTACLAVCALRTMETPICLR